MYLDIFSPTFERTLPPIVAPTSYGLGAPTYPPPFPGVRAKKGCVGLTPNGSWVWRPTSRSAPKRTRSRSPMIFSGSVRGRFYAVCHGRIFARPADFFVRGIFVQFIFRVFFVRCFFFNSAFSNSNLRQCLGQSVRGCRSSAGPLQRVPAIATQLRTLGGGGISLDSNATG